MFHEITSLLSTPSSLHTPPPSSLLCYRDVVARLFAKFSPILAENAMPAFTDYQRLTLVESPHALAKNESVWGRPCFLTLVNAPVRSRPVSRNSASRGSDPHASSNASYTTFESTRNCRYPRLLKNGHFVCVGGGGRAEGVIWPFSILGTTYSGLDSPFLALNPCRVQLYVSPSPSASGMLPGEHLHVEIRGGFRRTRCRLDLRPLSTNANISFYRYCLRTGGTNSYPAVTGRENKHALGFYATRRTPYRSP